ncbi:MAG: molybdopterin-dependent oxidoreductase [Hylemonella sp.]|uniref:molybdopterin-dependent oxidoreductase n=1 Tax=Hylemonella sp. TaxID=2066020 RepID=UPI0022BC7DBD|nr:molybdopterin-dependent oxidoreductase [Hylemonella sp.]MCZ8250934.1 molybdopterin-dependent oxidoreductase [Hylemonella sp.]
MRALLLLLCCWVGAVQAAEPVLLQVGGMVQNKLMLTGKDLQALPQKDYTERRSVIVDGREVVQAVTMRGIPLRALLDRAGLASDRHSVRRAYVLLTAQDGYQTLFSWGELYNARLGDDVLVLMQHGDDDLLARDGLPSLRSLQDVRPGPRHVRWLTSVEVLLAPSR